MIKNEVSDLKSKVYFSKDISAEKVLELYKLLGKELKGNVAIKVHSGEKGNQNFLKPDFWKPIIEHVNGTVVECNTAYEGASNTTERHEKLMEEHGWTKDFSVDILDSEGPDLVLPIRNGKNIKKNYVGKNIEKYDSVYNHARLAIDYALSRKNEKNGLLSIGDGDWNDGFSNIRGESVWLTFFMINLLDKFTYLTNLKFDTQLAKRYEKEKEALKEAVLKNTWDEDHFVRAFFENGEVLGSYKNKECKIDLISQAWAVISMKKYKEIKDKLETCLKTADKYLVDRNLGIVKLLYPSFNNEDKNNPGYIRAYVPGIRENGGQYTHASVWLAKAYFELNKYDEGLEILKMINPIAHSDTKEKADVYMEIYKNICFFGIIRSWNISPFQDLITFLIITQFSYLCQWIYHFLLMNLILWCHLWKR